jgi:hypothetical protein
VEGLVDLEAVHPISTTMASMGVSVVLVVDSMLKKRRKMNMPLMDTINFPNTQENTTTFDGQKYR